MESALVCPHLGQASSIKGTVVHFGNRRNRLYNAEH